MTRRELLPIAVITTIVLGAAWFFRDAFTARVSRPEVHGAPVRAQAPTLLPGALAQPGEAGPPSLAIRVTEALSDEPLEVDALVEFADVAGRFVAAVRGQRGKAPILFTGHPYQVLRARVFCREASEVMVGPVVCIPGVTQTFEVKLARLRTLHVRVPGARENKVVVSVFSEAPPEFGMAGPLVESAYPFGGACRLRLPPGDYWCVASSAAVRERFGPAQPPFDLCGPAWVQPVRIADADVVLDAELEDAHRTCGIDATVTGASPGEAISIEVFACGPGLLRRQVAKVEGDAGTAIQATNLPHGLLQVVAETGGTEAVKWLRLEPGESRALNVVLEPRHHRMNPFVTGPRVGRVRVTMQGKPAPGVLLVAESRDGSQYDPEDVFGKSGPDGVVDAGESLAGDYILYSIPYSAQRLEVAYAPGAGGEAVFELWPEGTGAIRFSVAGRSENFRTVCLLARRLEQEGMFLHERDGPYEVVGVPPGEQVVGVTDRWSVEHTMTVNVEQGRTTEVPRPFATRTVSGPVPGGRFWRDSSSFFVLDTDATAADFESGRHAGVVDKSPDFRIEQAPTRAFWLYYRDGEGVLAAARVEAGQVDVTVSAWLELQAPVERPHGTLTVRCRATGEHGPWPTVYLSRDRLPWTQIGSDTRSTAGREGNDDVRRLEAQIVPGSWRVKVEVGRGRVQFVTEHEVTVPAGGSATIEVEAPPPQEREPERTYTISPLWWTAPAPPPLQPAPSPALPTLTLVNAERYADRHTGDKLQIHVAGASLEELWHAAVRFRNSWSVAGVRVGAGRDDDSVSLVQVQGRPVILMPPDLGQRVILLVPGCKPVVLNWPEGARALAVTLERE